MLLILVVVFLLLWLLIGSHRGRIRFGTLSVRGAFVLAYLAFEFLLLAITELTSAGHHFTRWTVTGTWLVVIAALLGAAWPAVARHMRRIRSPQSLRRALTERLRRPSGEDWFWIAIVTGIMVILIVAGSRYPPSNADSLVYHLVRVEHWIQNRTVAPFAAHYLAQIDLAPLSEYNLAHLQLLSGTDRYDWCMQWCAAIVCIVGVSELARLLGAARRTQIVASVVCATIPIGVLLATTTENDYFAAAMVIAVLILLVSFSLERGWVVRSTVLGLAAGLAYMAKGTTLLFLAPAAVAFIGLALYRLVRSGQVDEAFRRSFGLCLAVGIGVVVTAGLFAAQNSEFGSVTGATAKTTTNLAVMPAASAGNVVRSTAANFDVGNGVKGVDTYLSRSVLPVLHGAYSALGVSPRDVRFLVGPYSNPFARQNYQFTDRQSNVGANPWNVLLIGVAVVVLVVAWLRGSRNVRTALLLAAALTGGFVAFAGSARWAGTGVRYQLPLLVAWSAVVAVALARFHRWIGRVVLIGLVIGCLPQLLNSVTQPVIHPLSFTGRPYLTPYLDPGLPDHPPSLVNAEAMSYETVADVLAQSTCRQAAITNWILFEYPLWVALGHQHWTGELNDLDVHNRSARFEPRNDDACASVSQQSDQYVTPANGTATVQEGSLAISLNPDSAVSVRAGLPTFSSTVSGVRVLPGGGWALEAERAGPSTDGPSTLYLFSNSARPVQIELHPVPGVPQPLLVVRGPGGDAVPTTVNAGVVRSALLLHRGSNQVDLTTAPAANSGDRLQLSKVTVAPLGP
ncbi:MAG: hypothetical protein ACRDYE_07085 [Acidimicrobiales bacterium]